MRTRLPRPFAVLLAAVAALGFLDRARAADETPTKPNVLWIVSEDNYPFLGAYGYPDADTPNLDKLASEGVRYDYAFATAPVCAPARCTIITGVYPPSMGTQHMRSRYPRPDHVKMFPEFLRNAGYFTTNHSKTDYNFQTYDDTAWDQIRNGDHTQRKEGQPFFAVYNIGTSHESSLHKPLDESLFDADVTVPPYHPDVPEIRANWAMYHRIITRMDSQVGEILKKLDEEGVADDTIVFYYGDHGGILPRSKRFLYDTGIRVPMIVRFGKNVQHLAPQEPGTASDRIVSFIDLAPTVLSLAGLEIPDYMQGDAFLGPKTTEPPEHVHCFRGRMDERYDIARSVRDHRYKYIRNYMPHRKWGQHLNYLWKMPATVAWEREYRAGRVTPAQRSFWEEKATEELYDTKNDPWEITNVADDPKYADVLDRMRTLHREQVFAIRDSGFMPEGQMIERTEGTTTYEYVRDEQKYPLERIFETAQTATTRDASDLPTLIERLNDEDSAVRYWAATGCVILKDAAKPATEALLQTMRDDESADVRLAAAEALCRLGHAKDAVAVIAELTTHRNDKVALHAVNVLEEIPDDDARLAMDALEKAAEDKDYVGRAASYTVERLTSEE